MTLLRKYDVEEKANVVGVVGNFSSTSLQGGLVILSSSMADPERFDADPDPTFQADADPDPAPDPDANQNDKILLLG